jgi:hypothetical protein
MNLSEDLFQQIVSSLGAGDATTLPNVTLPQPGGEQRRTRRFSADSDTSIRLIPLTDAFAPGPIDVRLRDVSPGGAGFLYHGRIPLDEQFVLILPSPEGQIAILSGVAYWQPISEDCYAIGAKFNRVLRQGSHRPTPTPKTITAPVRKAV